MRAERTGLWHVAPDGTELERSAPTSAQRYDRRRIEARIRETSGGERRWTSWFAAEGIDPLRVTYESLSAHPAEVVADILRHLHLDPRAAEGIEPGVAKLADETGREWVSRFRSERSEG